MTNEEAVNAMFAIWKAAGENRDWWKLEKCRTVLLNLARSLDAVKAPRPEEGEPSGMALAMKDSPSIKEAVMDTMRCHYWDSLQDHRDLILAHIEGALSWLEPSKPQPHSEKP